MPIRPNQAAVEVIAQVSAHLTDIGIAGLVAIAVSPVVGRATRRFRRSPSGSGLLFAARGPVDATSVVRIDAPRAGDAGGAISAAC